ncbi:MAG: 4Fe-4S dicluster domain-containing protein [Deltaproteobacteria bacterium]|nr:4Fe-4S dicluster domain-containing protein [Deltaproteobacteria bacterium]
MTEQGIYSSFMDWLKNTWIGLPESEFKEETIKQHFSVEEAEFLTGFPFRKTPLDELATLKGMTEKELTERLDPMAKKGLVWKGQKKGKVRYSLNEIFFSLYRSTFWPMLHTDHMERVAPPANQYFLHGMMEDFGKVEYKGLRTLPIHETIQPGTTVKPYEDVVKLLDKFEYYTVSACPCRQRKKLDPGFEDSKKPMEVCLHFDDLGHYIVENEMGREITREETEAVLKKAADAGLVHGLSNWQEKPDTICNCDKEYCIWFETYYQMDHHKSLDESNFEVLGKGETCKGCGLCVKRCPMEALSMVDYPEADRSLNKKALVPKLELTGCLGCGVCVVKCPTKSLTLVPRAVTIDPPQSVYNWSTQYLEDVKKGMPMKRQKN